MGEQTYRVIRNNSEKELTKLFNSEPVVVPAKSEVEVSQGLAFFLKSKFPKEIEILDDKVEKDKPKPIRPVLKVKKQKTEKVGRPMAKDLPQEKEVPEFSGEGEGGAE